MELCWVSSNTYGPISHERRNKIKINLMQLFSCIESTVCTSRVLIIFIAIGVLEQELPNGHLPIFCQKIDISLFLYTHWPITSQQYINLDNIMCRSNSDPQLPAVKISVKNRCRKSGDPWGSRSTHTHTHTRFFHGPKPPSIDGVKTIYDQPVVS